VDGQLHDHWRQEEATGDRRALVSAAQLLGLHRPMADINDFRGQLRTRNGRYSSCGVLGLESPRMSGSLSIPMPSNDGSSWIPGTVYLILVSLQADEPPTRNAHA
jgi:hypothetical protein